MKRYGLRQHSETSIQQAIQRALKLESGLMLMRNCQGVGGAGWRYGLGKGSADLIGVLLVDVMCGADPVGRCGRFIALEVKTKDGPTRPAQETWMRTVWAHGGFACVVRSVQEAREAIARARKGERW